MKPLLLLAILLSLNTMGATVTDSMLKAIIMQESSGRNGIVGDKNLPEHSYGVAQIRRQYLADVNKHYHKEVLKTWGRLLTLEDVQYSPAKSKFVVKRYLEHYGKAYEKRTGLKLTASVAFQIHNGGPSGYRKEYKKLYAQTLHYSRLTMRYYKT